MWFMVCRWPQSQEGDWVRRHLCKLARHQREQWSSWTRRVTSTCLVQFMYCAQTFICLQIFSTCSNFKFSVAVSLESSRIQLTPPLDPTRLSSRVVPRHVGWWCEVVVKKRRRRRRVYPYVKVWSQHTNWTGLNSSYEHEYPMWVFTSHKVTEHQAS